MSLFSSRLSTILLIFSFFNLEGVLVTGMRIPPDPGDDPDVSSDSDFNHLPPALDTIFILRMVIALMTFSQVGYSAQRFKSLHLPEHYDTGMLSRILLVSYTIIYLLFNILHAVVVASGSGLADGLLIATELASQFAIVLFYATLFSTIAYRQRLLLNPAQNTLNLKTVLDGALLVTILALGAAWDALLPRTGLNTNDPGYSARIAALENLIVAFQVFVFLASLNVAISSFMARARLSNANIRDRIINISAFAVSPIVVCGSIFGIVDAGLEHYVAPSLDSGGGLLIAVVVVEGVVSIATVYCHFRMSARFKLSSLIIC
ncbi:hypothetical protein Agabi119p4_6752 [Agaricus bisporus var. burnettii]|uniref:Transmembrane protein n=1 Tax=Agaricus bisporus var. burnettii TaxID=192524 RepID=A0A8H7CCC1_AGABI|nr:hypothetical protein Agabi119p4_6752 [Agaricus bisporus var. burnettii]